MQKSKKFGSNLHVDNQRIYSFVRAWICSCHSTDCLLIFYLPSVQAKTISQNLVLKGSRRAFKRNRRSIQRLYWHKGEKQTRTRSSRGGN